MAKYNGRWQTVLNTSVIDVRLSEERFGRGFYVVAMIDAEGGACGGGKEPADSKAVSKRIRVAISPTDQDIGAFSYYLPLA